MKEYAELLSISGVLSLLIGLLVYSTGIFAKTKRADWWRLKVLYTLLSGVLLWVLVPAFLAAINNSTTLGAPFDVGISIFVLPFLAVVAIAILAFTVYILGRR